MSKTISSSTTGPVVLGTADNPLYITSTGTVTSTGSADGIDGGAGTTWTISNAGVVSASSGNGVSLASSGIVGNTGSISGNDALVLRAGGSVTNDVGGSISGLGALGAGLGFGAGVYITGAAGTVTNRSTISGAAYGVGLGAGGLVTNTSSITGGEDGAIVQGAIGTIANFGKITATVDDGVALFKGGSVTNASGASISGAGGAGIFITGGAGTVTNAGSIAGLTHHGVLIAGGGSLSNAASGSISALGVGVFFESNPGTLTNAGFITGTGTQGTGIYLENGGSATNTSTGTITGHKFGAFLEGGNNTLANYGSISGATYDGAVLGLGGTVTNAAGASISGLNGGVYIKYRAAGTVTNSGSISATGTGSAGIDLADGGIVTNNSTGSVSGNNFGVFVNGAVGTVTNAGSIASVKYGGVDLVKGGSVTNSAGASIKGGSVGVYVGLGASGTATNSGSISAANASGAGVDLAGGGSITNNLGGSISGGGFGVFTNGALGTLNNSGSISGSHGVGLLAGGSITNAASGSIAGQTAGIFGTGGATTLSNAGNISATAGSGADIEGGGSITNLAGATISGSTFGVFLTGGSGTVTNAGTISGATYAIDFAGSATNRLIVDPGAVFVGGVTGGSGTSTLELASGTGSIGGVGTGSFNHFQVLAVDAGATWTLNGANIAPTVLDNGTISIAGSLDVSTGIDASSTGLFKLGSGATLEVAAATGAISQINFLDGTSELIIDNAVSFGTNVGSASYAGPELQHFAPGDKIDLKNFSSAGVTLNFNTSTGVLQVSNSANQVASLDFQTASLGGPAFAVSSDGATGIFITEPVPTVIEAFGTTSLVQVGGNYFLDPVAGGIGPELRYNGSPVVTGEFTAAGGGTWTPIGAEQTASGYEVAWKVAGANQYSVWNLDSSGNYIGNSILPTSGTSLAIESIETSFHQDLNGDGVIGIPSATIIESVGSTSLIQVGSNFYMSNTGSGTGAVLMYNGSPVVTGEFTAAAGGTWTPIGAEQTASGYEVAWKVAGANQYSVWNLDSSGNYIGNSILPTSGTSLAIESIETSFHQDLNGDGTIGVTGTVIESFGSTNLIQVGSNFYMSNTGSGTGAVLMYNGSPVVTGEFTAAGGGTWTPIGAEQTARGYEVAWKVAGANQYSVWNLDSSGNYIGNSILPTSGTSLAIESIETSFHQDLNGDGTIGVTGTGTVIESFGSTSLIQVGSNFYMSNTGSGTEAVLMYNGSPVVTGEFTAAAGGTWTPIGAEQTASGYEVAWKVAGANQYSVWNLDSSGNYIGNSILPTSGTSLAIESIETSFHQDLNGDGTIGVTGTVIESFGSTSLIQVGSNFYMSNTGSGTGAVLMYNGSPVVTGEFTAAGGGIWTPIGAEQTASGYEVAWKVAGANQYSVWNLDSSGNYIGNSILPTSGTSLAIESIETSFHQDLNGDGTIGVTGTVIESFGSTNLIQVGSNFYMSNTGSGTGAVLMYNGSPVVTGEFTAAGGGTWTPIGAEQTARGYEVAWKVAGANQYSVWNLDSSGNYIGNSILPTSGTSLAIESIETSFHQELTGGPTLTISNLAPTVAAGGSIPLGVQVTPSDADDVVSVTISGLTSYETITDNLDQVIFSGGSVALSAAEVNSGLTLHSSYGGTGHPVNNLIVTASNTTSGEAASPVSQTIVVTDPPVVASIPPQSILPTHPNVAMADFSSHGGAPPTSLVPSPYTTLAGLLDQYMAASSSQGAAGASLTASVSSQQTWLGGVNAFLTKPPG
ncbi:beta strand repeat-containing protein [Bradyrhizobium lablabi]|uniref:beta strand repeat-containing protein n=1 Tax=Bradyrhizobium lablabi TaxID=722472 RepID=UPI00090BB4F5|nr:hypothetical protein [Bradyrhizobium lablabi]SHM81545.1 Tryptophan-rich Synechocystis species C-terminal domain-containing protein [Bradyrhizobium lablabi]